MSSKRTRRSSKSTSIPTLFYWENSRGRAEAIRLTLALAGVGWKETTPSDDDYKNKPNAGEKTNPFGQWPILEDDDDVIAPSDAILRHLQRKHFPKLSLEQETRMDMVLSASFSLRDRYVELIYRDKCSDEGKTTFFTKVVDPTTIHGRNGGAHLMYVEKCLERFEADPWSAGTKTPTIADAYLVDMFHNICRVVRVGDLDVRKTYPRLARLHDAFIDVPSVAEYVSKRQPKDINGDGVGN